jgi:DNA-binding protein H-NS
MAKSLAKIQAQIAKLQKEAEAIRTREVSGVVAQLKAQIAKYGLTATDLGLVEPTGAALKRGRKLGRRAQSAEAASPSRTGGTSALPDAPDRKARAGLAKGKKQSTARRAAKAPKAAKVPGPVKYRDDQGNQWTGRGTRPKWYLAALAGGKTPEQLLVPVAP